MFMAPSPLSLQLTPNEIVGYRIKPDWNSFNVVLVKKHGPTSKEAGKEYETPLAYCKNLTFAAEWVFSHATRVKGLEYQKEQEQIDGSVSSIDSLAKAFEYAKAETLKSVAELQARMTEAGLLNKEIVKTLHSADPASSPDA